MEFDQSPPVKSVVIISLPPPDNPSLGKTITAFSVTEGDCPPSSDTIRSHTAPPSSSHHPIHAILSSLWSPRKIAGFFGISLFWFLIYSSFLSNSYNDPNNSEDDADHARKSDSFIFPVYLKRRSQDGSQRDVNRNLDKYLLREISAPSANVVSYETETLGSEKLGVSDISHGVRLSVIPVRGNINRDGLYYTHVVIGNPPRPYYLDIDTGSDLTWVQCDAPCSSCAKGANGLYKPRKSNIVPSKDSLCAEVQKGKVSSYCEGCRQCDYEVEYADNSSSLGVLAKDVINLMASNGSLVQSNFIFGCGYDQQGLLLTNLALIDGIFGLSGSRASLPAQLASRNIVKNMIGHCFTNEEEGRGYMFVGEDFIPRWGMAWVPMVTTLSQGFYQALIAGVKYGNSQLRLRGSHRVTFDTGSSYTYFPKESYNDLMSSLEELEETELKVDKSDPTLPVCWKAKFRITSVHDVKNFFKVITVQFEGRWRIVATKFGIAPEGYLVISEKGNVCLGILDGTKVHDGSFIIGDVSLHGKLMVYDNVNKRIGWMPSLCPMPSALQLLPFFDG